MQRILVPDIGNIEIEYSKRKSILIKVLPVPGSYLNNENTAKVTVIAPLKADISLIKQIVNKRIHWISRKKEFYTGCEFLNKPPEFRDDELVLFRGRKLKLKIVLDTIEFVENTGDELLIHVKKTSSVNKSKKLLENWYKETAGYLFNARTIELSKLLEGRHKKSITVTHRNMTRQWGSCSSSGKITLNTQLIKTPPECLDYVIIHELCHLLVMNHSKKYYNNLDLLLPDWKARQNLLKKYTCIWK